MLKSELDLLWTSEIAEYKFDIMRNEIVFKLRTMNNGLFGTHVLVLKGVSTCFFVNNNTDYRKEMYEITEEDYLEFTSINILNNIKILPTSKEKEEWIEQFSGEANISIEIWSKLLLIEVEKVEINGKEYLL